VAQHFGTQHREKRLDLDTARELIPDVLAKLDEPLGDASILPTYLLSRFVREHVTVALSGDGGDELFAGYDPFLALKAAEAYGRVVPPWLHRGMRSLAAMMPVSDRNMSLDFKIKRTLMGLSYPTSFRLPVWMAPLEPKELAEFLDAPVDPREVYSEAIELWEGSPGKHIVDRAMEFFTVFYLQDDILMKVDRAAMMCSLESRAVFLDNDLVDFCRRLPNRFKFRNGERKYLLKQVARRMLPARIVDRKKKGFGIPLSKWLRQLPQQAQPVSALGIGGDYARSAWSAHRAGRSDNRLFLWSLLSAEHVMAQFRRSAAA
jgi:asparagine synthase (glutamine-hydrolysing)